MDFLEGQNQGQSLFFFFIMCDLSAFAALTVTG